MHLPTAPAYAFPITCFSHTAAVDAIAALQKLGATRYLELVKAVNATDAVRAEA